MFRLQVQCEYSASHLMRLEGLQSLHAEVNPPPVVAQGSVKVQMRIARGRSILLLHNLEPLAIILIEHSAALDASFTSFFPEDELPLTLPLNKAAYVEISIAQPTPDPTLSLRVQDCFAYPESRHSVWMLLYDG